ncbi:hypothetical protein LXA43DRAFT_1099923 [Ganoderma leucocontextum]|nr:hypothetical protein LXA43DRAFT_1099923 [Ganoderma leucocontextum]
MEQTLQGRLRRLLSATSTTRETTQGVEDEANPYLSVVVISRSSSATTHWAIALVTDERSRQCRVFHLSDAHILGLRARGRTVFVQDEILDRSSGYRGGVRIGLVERDDLSRLQEIICGNQLPPTTSDIWDCEDWTLAVIKHLEDQGFMLVTHGMDGGTLINQLFRDSLLAQRLTERHNGRPVFVPLSLPSIRH